MEQTRFARSSFKRYAASSGGDAILEAYLSVFSIKLL
jgi:hypothetical protein